MYTRDQMLLHKKFFMFIFRFILERLGLYDEVAQVYSVVVILIMNGFRHRVVRQQIIECVCVCACVCVCVCDGEPAISLY